MSHLPFQIQNPHSNCFDQSDRDFMMGKEKRTGREIRVKTKTLNDRIGKRRGKILRINLECKHDEAKGA
ncbi:hypothetical protein T4E_2456 [Trichinella pseudospiralis]|uniref:Uncharacterized protein n=1 Tax=Trichinella pseudospiralis TaxID=6337 RepID=A0A0V1FK51_TRIPS|nr:hypothetical protein T4E_2456 [Trichinella pseudospiralis]KRY86332.1 hypothetical protein T4D_3647 [Trichinella pseudospiralis]